MEAPSRPASGRIKHELLTEEAQLDAYPNDRYHYSIFGFLQKRRGGGGGSKSSGGSSFGSSSPSRGSSASSSPGKSDNWLLWSKPAPLKSPPSSSSSLSSSCSGRPWRKPKPSAPKSDSSPGSSSKSSSKPSTPKSGSSTGGSSSSKPRPPALAPPTASKLPKLPKLPKPKPGWKPPKGSLPGYPPGKPPYRGSGGHLPKTGGGHSHDDKVASLGSSCIHPKGMDRLRCQKADAVVGTIFAIIAFFLVPFLIYQCVMYYKRRKGAQEKIDEEDGIELTSRAMDCNPGPQTDREIPDDVSNIVLATSTSEDSFTFTKEQTQGQSCGSSPGRQPPPAYQPRTRSVSRGRKPFRNQHSIRSVTSSLFSVRIRTARLGRALQDPKVIDVPPSLAGSRKDSKRRCSSSDVERFSHCNHRGHGEGHCSKDEGRGCVDTNVEDGDKHEEAERRSRSSSHGSGSHVSEQQVEEERCPDDAVSRCSSRGSRSCGPSDQPDDEADTVDDTVSRRSVSRLVSPASCHEDEDGPAMESSEA